MNTSYWWSDYREFSPGEGVLPHMGEIKLAWEALTPDFFEWRMYFSITEARLSIAERDLESSAQLGLDALQVARTMRSKKGEGQVRDLYLALRQLEKRNPYTCNLGVQLGMF